MMGGLRRVVPLSVAGLCCLGLSSPIAAQAEAVSRDERRTDVPPVDGSSAAGQAPVAPAAPVPAAPAAPAPAAPGEIVGAAMAEFDDVVVTATGYQQAYENAPASISVVPRRDLEKRYYRNVTDALRQVPGVVITGGGAGDDGRDISIRGMPSQYTLLLVDGKRQSARESRPNGSAGFEQDFLPPLQAIERIEVVRGPMSTLYGSDAIGGVVNVITRKVADEWLGGVQLDAIVQDNGESGDRQQGQFYVSGPLVRDLLGIQLTGKVSRRAEDRIINGYEAKDLHNIDAKLSFTPTPYQDFTLEAGAEEQTREQRIGFSVPETGCRGGCSDSFGRYERQNYALTHTGRWGFATSDSHVQYEASENKARDIAIDNTNAKSTLVVPLGNHMVSVGASFEYESLEDGTTNRISDRTEIDHYGWALFAEDTWQIWAPFALTVGARLDEDENYDSNFSPRLYGVWETTDNLTIKGGVSTGFRAPGLREITPDFGQISRGGNVYGNTDLQPETSINQEINLLYTTDWNARASLALFHSDFEDKITRVACPDDICGGIPNQFGAFPTYRVNVDEAETQGVEVALSSPLGESADFSVNYTYTDSEQKSGDYAGRPLTQLPRHEATAEVNWQATERLSPWARATYRGEESQPTGGRSAGTLVAPSYTFVDIGTGYDLAEGTTLHAGVYNLFDERVAYDEYGYVEDGRRYWFGLKQEF